MASLATACRLSTRIVGRRVAGESAVRGFRTSAQCLAAQNFTMPALSPTMTEGNIASWKVKDGETFSAGDVLLEIETDKATMDVEAQDDGIMMKIMTGDGSKAVQVGTRIAVLAEAGDDISSLELPADESPKQETPKSDANESAQADSASAPAKKSSPPPTDGKKFEQKYPLYPSVQQLAHLHNLDADTVASITPTGPQGRLLKGDVLAFIGSIKAEAPGKVSERYTKLSHLDLSDIKVAKKKEAAATTEAKPTPDEKLATPPPQSEVAVPITLAKVIEVQRRVQDTLGVFLPVSTFIARAAEVANDDLPPSSRQPTANELFDQVLGLDKLQPRTSRGAYLPQIAALPEASFVAPRPAPRKQADIFDVLAAQPKKKAAAPAVPETIPGLTASGTNVFSLVVPRGDEKRATVFLGRVKAILETDPGRLVL